MVDIVQVQEASYRISKVGVSGYDSLPDFLAKANEVNIDAMNILTPHYGKIKAVDDILNIFVKPVTCDFVSGLMGIPDDYYGYIDMVPAPSSPTKLIRKIKTNQIAALQLNSIRTPTNAYPKIYLTAGNINIDPVSAGAYNPELIYFRVPDDVSITTTPVESETDDYETVTAQTNYEWPARMKNLLIYLLVQRLGAEMKEPILFEIAQLGITMNLDTEPVS